jgi:hypothetical protein
MRYYILFFLSFLSFVVTAQYQETIALHPVDLKLNQLIARSGLLMRAEPNFKSRVISKIPHKAKIEYVANQSLVDGEVFEGKTLLKGRWVKVKYNKQIGYVLDVYLYYSERESKCQGQLDSTSDYALLFPGKDCVANWYETSKYHWYGVYSNPDSTYQTKKVDVTYYSVNADEFGWFLGITTGQDEGLLFIYGSKKVMPDGKIKSLVSVEIDANAPDFSSNWLIGTELKLSQNPSRVYGNFEILPSQKILNSDVSWVDFGGVRFVGDLNQDGILDYVFGQYNEVSQFTLALSSPSGLKMVAIYCTHYCC